MPRSDLNSKLKERLERQMAKLQQRLAEVPVSDEVEVELTQVKAEISDIEHRIEVASAHESEVHPRLQVRLERLLAKQERLELKLELLEEKRDRLSEGLAELKLSYEQNMGDAWSRSNSHSHRGHTSSVHASRPLEEERRKILEMLQQGKITVEDATRLLDALGEQAEKVKARRKPRWVRIRVTDTTTNHTRVNLTLPIGLVRAGLRAGGSIAGIEGLDTLGLQDLLNRGEAGYLWEIEDPDSGEHVEILVE